MLKYIFDILFFMKIKYKMLFTILSAVILIFFALLFLSYVSSRTILTGEIKKNAEQHLKSNIYKLETLFQKYQNIPEHLATATESLKPLDEENIKNLIKNNLLLHPEVYGSTISFEPYSFSSQKELFGPYYHRTKDNEFMYVDLSNPSYNYPTQEWYKNTVISSKPLWTKPYLDVGGGDTEMITYVYPFFKDGKIWGVATVDVSMSQLTDVVEHIKVGKGGFGMLISETGIFLSSNVDVWEMKKTIFDIAKEYKNEKLEKVAAEMIAGKTGFTTINDPLEGKIKWIAYAPIPATGWALAILLPQEELMADLKELARNMTGISIVGIVIITFIVYLISRRISRPISELADASKRISSGDFTTKLKPMSARDELGTLSNSFTNMQMSLQKTMDQLNEEKEMFKIAFSEMSDGLVILDPQWKILQFNHSAQRLMLLEPSTKLIEHLQLHFDSTHPISTFDQITDKFCSCKLSRKESENLGPLHLSCIIAPILDENKNLRERVISIRDITASETEESTKRNFLSLISHKLFTPLSVLQGKIMLLKDGLLGELNDKQEKNVISMVDQSRKLNELIEGLVSFVSIEEAKLDMSKEKIELQPFLTEIVEINEKYFPDKHPSVNINIDPDLQEMSFNKKYLFTIINQLIDNGLKFNLSNPAAISVECKRDENNISFVVKDNGIGIPPEFIDKIFDKFYQIDRYFTGNVEGVGLGLSYVKKIVETFGGSITVNSKPGEGSTFTVKLPVV